MAKKVEESAGDSVSHEAIKPQKMNDLVAKVANANKAITDATQRKGELISNAVENDKLHKGAFATFMKLRKMDPVAREAFRFNLEVYCEREWGPNKDLLRTPGEQPTEAEEDLRPRHLRQPGASAAAPSTASAAVKAIAENAEANLSRVGRGPDAAKH